MKISAGSTAAAIFAASVLATGCASVGGDGPYGYKSSGGIGDHGYSENHYKDRIWFVTYTGHVAQPPEQLNANLLRRAKELCLHNGYAAFNVKDLRQADLTVGGGSTSTGVSLPQPGSKVVNIGTSSGGPKWPSLTGHVQCQ